MSQILRVSTSRSNLPNLILSAGDDQVSICSAMVYLEATIAAGGIGHPTEWEQISGTPTVTLIEVSPTQSYYETGDLVGSDKTFRFYIDRGTQIESYMDVTVYTTPTSTLSDFQLGDGAITLAPKTLAMASSIQQLSSIPFDTSAIMGGAGDTALGVVDLTWGLPNLFLSAIDTESASYAATWLGTIVQQWGGSTWVTAQTYATTDVPAYSVVGAQRLRIGNVYQLPGQPVGVVYDDWFVQDASATLTAACNATLSNFTPGVAGVATVIDRTVYVLLMLEYIEPVTPYQYGSPEVVTTDITSYVYTLLLQDGEAQIESFTMGSGSVNFTVTRTSGGTLGG